MSTKQTKKLDPNALFVIMTISRAGIAERLNEAIEETDSGIELFQADDACLTDKTCQEIADKLYDALCDAEGEEQLAAESGAYVLSLERFA